MSEEKKRQVTAGADDANSIRSFVKHFNLEMKPYLEEALVSFEKDMTFENQERVRLMLAKFVVEDTSGLLQDKMFGPIFQQSTKVEYYNSFEENLTELLDKEETENQG